MDFGSLSFLSPLALAGLLTLPLIWWLLRAIPPRPKQETFPPIRILADVVTDEETPDSTPLWLLLFRMLLVALIAFALARPVFLKSDTAVSSDLVVIMDNGYASAANWAQTQREAESRLTEARRNNVDAILVTTQTAEDIELAFAPATEALERVKTLLPNALTPQRAALAETLGNINLSNAEVVWLADGVDYGNAAILGQALSGAAMRKIFLPASENAPVFAGSVTESERGFRAAYTRADTNSLRNLTVVAYSGDGNVLDRSEALFGPGIDTAEAEFELPADLRNRVSMIRPEGAASAGAVKLLDDSWGRPVVGVMASADDNKQPLLSELYYVEKALGPNADIFKAPLSELLALSPSIIVMSDTARSEDPALAEFVDNGGMLIRFAGPKLAARTDALLPVDLRFGGRALGGALTWDDPQALSPFEADSPFYGLTIPDDVTITQQVMAEPGAETDTRTWARLTDGSPIVTSALRGQGRIVLFHVTSGPEWSNLAVSGLYVSMLKRILPLARNVPSETDATGGVWQAERVLDGFGRLVAPPVDIAPIADGTFDDIVISAQNPPGLYRQGSRLTALNAVRDPSALKALNEVSGMTASSYGQTRNQSIMGLLLGLAMGLLALDALIALIVSGRLKRVFQRPAILAMLIGAVMLGLTMPQDAYAQDDTPNASTDALALHFAYVRTGNDRLDRKSAAGLRGVTRELTRRTTVEPAEPRGVNLETDSLVFYPFLYWPVTRDAPELSPKAASAVNAYLASGGTLVFDTQDQGDMDVLGGLSHPGLARLSSVLDIPQLQPVPEDHVLTKSFFLIDSYPGRWADGQVWVDAQSIGARDGVARVILGSNDWASAWSVDDEGNYFGPMEETMPRQREMSKRFGVNLGMYILAGNYKADQVHVAATLERLNRRDGGLNEQ